MPSEKAAKAVSGGLPFYWPERCPLPAPLQAQLQPAGMYTTAPAMLCWRLAGTLAACAGLGQGLQS